MTDRIGMVGLGVMGSAMSRNLVKAGFDVTGFDIDDAKVREAAAVGVTPAGSTRELAESVDVVLFSLASVEALQDATRQVASTGKERLLVVEMGTLPIDAKRAARDELAAVGIEMMDVPLSGTGLQAADATLVVFASGPEHGYQRITPLLEAIGRSHYYLGEFGNGSVMKYIANLLVTIHTLAAAEAHVLGIAAGMDPQVVQRVMSDGVGSSKMFDIRGPMMAADRYDPPAARVGILLKDSKIIREYAQSVGAPTPLLDAAMPYYQKTIEAGLGDLDAAALCRYLEQTAGLKRKA